MLNFKKRANLLIWQVLFLSTGLTWLLAPFLNQTISGRTSLISQYETTFQPYSWIFRFGDVAAALLLAMMAIYYVKSYSRQAGWLLMLIALGSLLDPLLTTSCHMHNGACHEYVSFSYVLHAIESTVTALAVLALSAYDVRQRQRLVSVFFLFFQPLYVIYSLTQISTQHGFNTLSQLVYQSLIIIWLTWYCRDSLNLKRNVQTVEAKAVRYIAFAWGVLNGLLAIALSFYHTGIFGRLQSIYFARGSEVLAQHGIVVGVTMLYLSRHLLRGEERARQIFLILTGIETIKYAAITPQPMLLAFYFLTFIALFVLSDDFDRGSLPLRLSGRLKEAGFLSLMLTAIAISGLGLLYALRPHIFNNAMDHFFDYAFESRVLPHLHRSILVAHLLSVFVISSLVAILWTLFRPIQPHASIYKQKDRALELLNQYANSSEDYFKYWPEDKEYYWSKNQNGFIAYKIVGPIIFALADPIASHPSKSNLLKEFMDWSKQRRLTACFMPIYTEASRKIYEDYGLQVLQIGSSAMVDPEKFVQNTSKDKWWRWQKNRATKAGYEYAASQPPHDGAFLGRLQEVSDSWLEVGGHTERGFAMGYFDKDYLNTCTIHYLKDRLGRIVAFTNQIPDLASVHNVSIDLLRHDPETKNTMPYLLASTIGSIYAQGYKNFDLGFVPFAASDELLLKIGKVLAAGQFSAAGLEQFKNKFDPVWQPTYLAYDGDMADLARIVIKLEKALKIN